MTEEMREVKPLEQVQVEEKKTEAPIIVDGKPEWLMKKEPSKRTVIEKDKPEWLTGKPASASEEETTPADKPATQPTEATSTEGKHSETTPTAEKPTAEKLTDEELWSEYADGHQSKIRTFQDWLDAHPPESEAERKKRERRERSKRVIAALSDGLGALSNLYFTSRYAPNAYNHNEVSAKKAVDERIERMKADRQKRDEEYLRYALALGDSKSARATGLYNLRRTQRADKRAEDEHEWKRTLRPFIQKRYEYERDNAENKANVSKAEADYADRYYKAKAEAEEEKPETEKSKQTKNKQQGQASVMRANKSGGGRGSGGRKSSGGYMSEVTVTEELPGGKKKTTKNKYRYNTPTGSAKSKFSIHKR